MKKLFFVFMLIFSSCLFADLLETFDNSSASNSYSNGSFIGVDGIEWTYVASRDANGDANNSGINLPAIMLRRVSSGSKITSSSIPGGIATFSMKLYKGFTGAGNRQVELFVNGVSKGVSTPFDDFNEHLFTVSNINVTGDIIIEIKNITSKQVIIDDISIVSYAPSNPGPTISDVTSTPEMVTSSDDVNVTATITDDDGIVGAEIHYGFSVESLTFISEMIPMGNDIYAGIIPAQNDGTTIYYEIYALDNELNESSSSTYNYTVTDPATATLPYSETFDADLGDCYTYSVSGGSKTWGYYSGSAQCNGYNSGDIEEDWLILPAINLDNYTNEVLSFDTQYKYGNDDADNYLKLYYSVDYPGLGNPTGYTWQELPYTQPSGSEVWENSGNISLATIIGENVSVAFKYRYTSGNYRRWSIDNISIMEVATTATEVANDPGANTPANVDIPPVASGTDVVNPDVVITPQGAGTGGQITVQVQSAPQNPASLPNPQNVALSYTITIPSNTECEIVLSYEGLSNDPTEVLYWTGTAYMPVPNPLIDPIAKTITFTIVIGGGRASTEFIINKGAGSTTLPVELSSFAAVVVQNEFVQLNWVAESETDHLGYNLYRSLNNDGNDKQKINNFLIQNGDALGTQISYSYDDNTVMEDGTYYYWLQSVDNSGADYFYGPVMVEFSKDGDNEVPQVVERTVLYNAYPNPFNPTTNISFDLVQDSHVTLDIYNIKGKKVKTLVNQFLAGNQTYKYHWDGKDENNNVVASGVYFFQLNTDTLRQTKKAIMVK